MKIIDDISNKLNKIFNIKRILILMRISLYEYQFENNLTSIAHIEVSNNHIKNKIKKLELKLIDSEIRGSTNEKL